MNRREFLTTLLAVPLAGIKLPPTPGTWGAIVRSECPMFRNAPLIANEYLDKNMIYLFNKRIWNV